MIESVRAKSLCLACNVHRWQDRRVFFVALILLFVVNLTMNTYLSSGMDPHWNNENRFGGSRAHRTQEASRDSWSPGPRANLGKNGQEELTSCSSLNMSKGMILIMGGTVYTPENIGQMEVLIAGGKIIKFLDPTSQEAAWLARSDMVQLLNATGAAVTPGLVDIHVHLTGGGGEAGPGSRVPEARVAALLRGGLTTVVGVLGMDSVTRSPDVLIAKVAALNEGPITAFMWTGAYGVLPAVPTVTGSLQRDVALLPPCVGVKVAISDHRASPAGPDVFRAVAAQALAGGMVGGKRGLVYLHVGAGAAKLDPLWDIVRNTAIPPLQLLPTHMGRTPELVNEGIAWARAGGAVDVSANSAAPRVVREYAAAGVLGAVSVSSDAYGSLPKFDSARRLIAYSYARPDRLLRFLRAMVAAGGGGAAWPLERALALVTAAPARRVGLAGKGVLAAGGDADVLVLDGGARLGLRYVVARGAAALSAPDGCVDHDMFEGGT